MEPSYHYTDQWDIKYIILLKWSLVTTTPTSDSVVGLISASGGGRWWNASENDYCFCYVVESHSRHRYVVDSH